MHPPPTTTTPVQAMLARFSLVALVLGASWSLVGILDHGFGAPGLDFEGSGTNFGGSGTNFGASDT